MKLGRNFTNMLEIDYLSKEQRAQLTSGDMDVSDMDFITQDIVKADILHQIDMALDIGIEHIELDGAVPNPYLGMPSDKRLKIQNYSKEKGITLSVHLPYTYVCQSLCAFQETDRQIAVDLLKRYIDFAGDIGAIAVNMHPGSVPYYQTGRQYKEGLYINLKKSLIALSDYAAKYDIKFHLENNTAYDIIFVNPQDGIGLVEDIRSDGHTNIFYNLDIGHWFTILNEGGVVPDPPEKVIEQIPDSIIFEFHLNDYVVKSHRFHPPLYWQSGLLKEKNILNYFSICKQKGVSLVVVETAIRKNEEALGSHKILREEHAFIKKMMELEGTGNE